MAEGGVVGQGHHQQSHSASSLPEELFPTRMIRSVPSKDRRRRCIVETYSRFVLLVEVPLVYNTGLGS